MADLREQLRRIEAAPPPDLWARIETRVSEEGPQMDGNITSIDAFRTPGWDRRHRIAAGLVAAAVVALTVFAAWEAFRVPVTVKRPQGSLPAGWERCSNDVLGYSIGYPSAWHTTEVFNGGPDPANACRWFSPQPFGPDGNVVAEGWGYPLEVATGRSFANERIEYRVPETVQVLDEEPTVVDGHRAIRLEYVLEDVVADAGRHYQYVIELGPQTTLIVHTTETRGVVGDYEKNKEIVDDAVDTLRFEDAAPSS